MKAVIDVGSNSILLICEEQIDGRWQTVCEGSWVTGLGAGTKATGVLSEKGMTDSLAAIKTAFDQAKNCGCCDIQAFATMAVRIATNQNAFLTRADAQGTPVKVLSGDDEAQFGFMAITNDPMFADKSRLTIIDPGGNSTELTTAQRTESGWQVLFRRSYPVGALGLRDGVLKSESPNFAERLQAVAEIDDLIGLRYLPGQTGTIVALGAAPCNLISIRERYLTWQPDKVHGAYLDFEEISKAVGWMSDMTDAERAEIPGIEPGRNRTIHIGSLILERFLQAVHGLGCHASIRGWRHGILESK